jgi:GNAT superfamily N-acetyltransferase
MTQDIELRPMTFSDIPLGMRLKTIANWNQLETDWEFLVSAGKGGNFVASYKGDGAGTVTTLHYQGRFSWIGMVLVDPRFRGLGIGRALLDAAIKWAERKGAVRLDATPQGEKLYHTMGFKRERELVRLQRDAAYPSSSDAGKEVKGLSLGALPLVAALDAPAFGADRTEVLNYLFRNAPDGAFYTEKDQKITGYCLGRKGSNFKQIGPIVAQSLADAKDLLLTTLSTSPDTSLILDAMAENKPWLDFLHAIGFRVQRPLIRMYLGDLAHPGDADLQYAIAGPELG